MKKIFLVIIICFAFINNVSAASIEDQLNALKNDITNLKSEVSSLNNQRLNKTYPVGSIYITTTYSTATAVANALGGSWESYGSGRTLVGVNTSDSNFNTVSKTGGTSTTTLSQSNLPSHTHSIPVLHGLTSEPSKSLTGEFRTRRMYNASTGDGTDVVGIDANDGTTGIFTRTTENWPSIHSSVGFGTNATNPNLDVISIDATHTHTVTTEASTTGSSGSSTSFTNLQPYITVYMYRRTA